MTDPTPAGGEPNVIERNIKAILGALVALATALGVVIADPSTSAILPESWSQWIATGIALVVAFGGIYGIRNARTVKQAQGDLDRALARETKRTTRKRRPAKRAPRLRHPSAPDPAAAVAEPVVLAEDADDDPGRHRAGDGA